MTRPLMMRKPTARVNGTLIEGVQLVRILRLASIVFLSGGPSSMGGCRRHKMFHPQDQSRINCPICNFVIPAQAGTQNSTNNWFPACAGMTKIVALSENGKLFQPRPLAFGANRNLQSKSVTHGETSCRYATQPCWPGHPSSNGSSELRATLLKF
jgi:hypothetical protein